MTTINESNQNPLDIDIEIKQETALTQNNEEKNKDIKAISIKIKDKGNHFKVKNEKVKSIIQVLDNVDKNISKPLHTYSPDFKVECIFYCFARLFNIDTVIIYLLSIVIYSFLKYKNGYMALIPICHVICGALITVLIKFLIKRPRPILKTKRYFRLKESNHSMPSGDSLQAGIFATMIIIYFNSSLRYFGILLIPAAMLGRIFYNLHYWLDCIIGATMGICISIGTYMAINKLFF